MTDAIISIMLEAAERSALPDAAIRFGTRRLCSAWLRLQAGRARPVRLTAGSEHDPVAALPEAANQKHGKLPAAFFEEILGPALKFNCCYWERRRSTLAEAEIAALRSICSRAQIEDGQTVLELGCGWGSAALWIAQHYPHCAVTAVANSESQRNFILSRSAQLCLDNIKVLTAEIDRFRTHERFDRVISIEIFKHVRNHAELMRRIAGWLNPDGKLFVQICCHRRYTYEFGIERSSNWMRRHFFTGGMMPSEALLPACRGHLSLHRQWSWNGIHYRRTAQAWLQNLDRDRNAVLKVLRQVYAAGDAELWLARWRIFFLVCAELWGYRGGTQWHVAHYLFRKPST